MIDVKNLTKIYTSDGTEVLALNSVSFHLPEKGLAFIVGKSGSGKSTLLNMLGALDDITSGDIVFEGKSLFGIRDHDANTYRNTYLGIVYQNYNLFENETVEENIKTGVGATFNDDVKEKIEYLLKEVELEGIRKRKVKKLSGGQKQRVAIARALAKEPKLLLADEPTGNLDSKTAKTIFELFKKISKDKLVVIVTHDLKSAHEYADRIIHIEDSVLVEDLIRNDKYVEEHDGKFIYVDSEEKIDQEEIEKINKNLPFSRKKLKKVEKKFKKYIAEKQEGKEQQKFEQSKTNYKHIFRSVFKIIKNNRVSFLITTILSVILVSLVSLATVFINFNGKNAARDSARISGAQNIMIEKGYSQTDNPLDITKTKPIRITEKDDELIRKSGYKGKKYPVYSVNMPACTDGGSVTSANTFEHGIFYSRCGSGIALVDFDYLNNKFKDYEVLAGSMYDMENSTSLIVTDYFADAILFNDDRYQGDDESDPYANLINRRLYSRYTIGAVINTNYKVKHAEMYGLQQKLEKGLIGGKEMSQLMVRSKEYRSFKDDVISRLNFGYTLNPNYFSDYPTDNDWTSLENTFFGESQTPSPYTFVKPRSYLAFAELNTLTGDNVKMNAIYYNALFGTNISDDTSPDFKPKTLYLYNYGYEQDIFDTPAHIVKIEIVGISNRTNINLAFECAPEKFKELRQFSQFPYAYLFDDVGQAFTLYENLMPEYWFCRMYTFDPVFNMIRIINIFEAIFIGAFAMFMFIVLMVIVLYSNRTVNKEKYRIGIYKSLGYSNTHLNLSFLFMNLFMIIVIFVGAAITSYGLSFLANWLLQDGFAVNTKNTLYYSLNIIPYKFVFVAIYSAITFGFLLISSLIPLLKIRKIKPNNIIREAK